MPIEKIIAVKKMIEKNSLGKKIQNLISFSGRGGPRGGVLLLLLARHLPRHRHRSLPYGAGNRLQHLRGL